MARQFTLFAQRTTRAATVLTELLGTEFSGVVTCDRAKMYWMLGRLQWCWAHLKRDFQALIDSGDPQAKRLGHELIRPTREMFHYWGPRYRDGLFLAVDSSSPMEPICRKVESLLLRGSLQWQPPT